MAEEKAVKTSRFRFGRKTTIGVLGGITGGMLLYFAILLFRVAINAISPAPAPVPINIELAGLPLGFSAGSLIALEEFGE